MENKKKSFFERITGSMRAHEHEDEDTETKPSVNTTKKINPNWMEEENDEAELTVDVFQTAGNITIQTMVAGVKPEDLDLTIGRDMLTIKGKRSNEQTISEENYFTKELYWGKFSRTILLPQEVEPDQAEATEKHGLLTIRLQKIDKEKKTNVKVKSI